MPEYIPRAELPKGLDDFTRGYLECAEWAGLCDDDMRQALELSVSPRWDAKALAQIVEDCAAFQRDNAADLEGIDATQAGHDFHLTRNGHGAGFWDRGLGSLGQRLSDACKPWGSTHVWFDENTETLYED